MIERCFDPNRLYEMASHPAVAPGLTNYDLDKLAPMVADQRNVVLMDGPICAVFEWCAPFVFEIHALVLPEGRGRKVIEVGKAFLRHMASEFGALMIWGGPPYANRAVRWLARQIGMSSLGVAQWPNGRREAFVWGAPA